MTDTPEVNDIPAILARADAATEGPWKYVRGVGYVYASDCITAPCRQNLRSGPFNSEQWGNDAEFIAHSRTDVPNMAAEILSLRADKKRLAVLEELREKHLLFLSKRDGIISIEKPLPPHFYTSFTEAADAELSRREKENG